MALMPVPAQGSMIQREPVRYYRAARARWCGRGVVSHPPALAGHYDVIAPDLWGPRRYQGQALTLETGVQFIGGLLEAGASGE